MAHIIKTLAGISFSLYAFHYPLMLFWGAVNERYVGLIGLPKLGMLLALIILSVFLLSCISEKRKKNYMKFFLRFFKTPLLSAKK